MVQYTKQITGDVQSMNVTVNGLAIDESGSLARYFRDNVITGPDAFVIAAQSFEDFAVSIKRKLLRELGQKNIANR